MKAIGNIGEDALISHLLNQIPLSSGLAAPGDDCAVIDTGGETLQLLKTDAMVCGVHFLADTAPRRVGWKAAARVISDFAAMGGGRLDHLLITLALTPQTQLDWVEDLYLGIGDCLRAHGGTVAGGETTRLPSTASNVISMAATGRVARPQLTLRSTARPGDVLLVTGRLGGSLAGKHLDFTPRQREADWLAGRFRPTAMMDLSDGLAKDLPRLAAASACGFHLQREQVPCSPGCTVDQALGDGEDYELLLSVDPNCLQTLLHTWPQDFPDLPLSAIGTLCEAGRGDPAPTGGWDHFGKS